MASSSTCLRQGAPSPATHSKAGRSHLLTDLTTFPLPPRGFTETGCRVLLGGPGQPHRPGSCFSIRGDRSPGDLSSAPGLCPGKERVTPRGGGVVRDQSTGGGDGGPGAEEPPAPRPRATQAGDGGRRPVGGGPGAPRRRGGRRAALRAIPERLREIQPGFDSDRPRCPQPANVTKNSRHGGWTGATAAAGRAGLGRRTGGRAEEASAGRAGAVRAGTTGGRGAPGFTCLWNVQCGIGSGLRVAIRSGNCAAPEAGGRWRGIVGIVVRCGTRAAWPRSGRPGCDGWDWERAVLGGATGSVIREQAAWTGEQGARSEQAACIWSGREKGSAFQLPFPRSGKRCLAATRYPLSSGWAGPRDPD